MAIFVGHAATLTSELDFQHEVSCSYSVPTTALKRTILELGVWDRWTEYSQCGGREHSQYSLQLCAVINSDLHVQTLRHLFALERLRE